MLQIFTRTFLRNSTRYIMTSVGAGDVNMKENIVIENQENLPIKKCKLADAGDFNVELECVKFARMSNTARVPIYGTAGAVGADICSDEDCIVPARGKRLIHTGLQMAVPVGYYARVAPRSGLALKHSIDVGAGVVDPDYRGEVNVLLFNLSDVDFEVKAGDRIAQIVFEKCARLPLVECITLSATARGAEGFGSTGIREPLAETTEPQDQTQEKAEDSKQTCA